MRGSYQQTCDFASQLYEAATRRDRLNESGVHS